MRKKTGIASLSTFCVVIPLVLMGSLGTIQYIWEWEAILKNREIAWHGERVESEVVAHTVSLSPDGTYALIQDGNDWIAMDTVTGETLWTAPTSEFFRRYRLISNRGEAVLTHSRGEDPVNMVHNGRDGSVRFLGADLFPEEEEDLWYPIGINDAGTLAVYRTSRDFFSDPRMEVRVVNLANGETVFDATMDDQELADHWFRLNQTHFDDSGEELIISDDFFRTTFHLDLNTGAMTHHPRIENDWGASKLVVAPDIGKYAYHVPVDGIRINDFPSHNLHLLIPTGEDEVVQDLAFNGDGSQLLIISKDEWGSIPNFRWIDTNTSETLATVSRPRGEIVGKFVHDGMPAFLEAGPGNIEFLDVSGNELWDPIPYARSLYHRAIPFDNDNSMMVVNTRGYFSVFDMATESFGDWKPLSGIPVFSSITVARKGHVAIHQTSREIVSIDLYTGEMLQKLRSLGEYQNGLLAISHDGSIAALGVHGENGVSIIEPTSGSTLGTIETDSPMYSLTMTPDGSTLAFVHEDSVTSFEVNSGELVARIDFDLLESETEVVLPPRDFAFPMPFVTMALTADGRHLAITSIGQRAVPWLFDFQEGSARRLVGNTSTSPTHDTSSALVLEDLRINLDFSPDGHRLLISPRGISRTITRRFGGTFNQAMGSRLIDIRNRHHIREYYSAPAGTPPIDPSLDPRNTPYNVAGGIFSLGGGRILGLQPEARTLVFHNSGISGDNLSLVRLNLLSIDAPLPATAPGVDVSDDGVLDAADLIYTRR